MKPTKTKTIFAGRNTVQQGYLILVNASTHLAPHTQALGFEEIVPDVLLEKRTAIMYKEAMKHVCGAGKIVPVSGYRSRAEQERIFADTITKNGLKYAKTYVALPGCSEHQTGLAVDVGLQSECIDFIAPDFPYDGVCQNFRYAAFRHGFIQRYPEGKRHITGIGHEPWHFRYVGIPHSLIITSMGFTLEEYVQWSKAFPFDTSPYRFEMDTHVYHVGYIPAGEGAVTEIEVPSTPYTISGNNVDGFIIAVWGNAYE